MSYFTPTHLAARAVAQYEARRQAERAARAAHSEAPAPRAAPRRDVLAALAQAGHLPPESRRAGQEIAEVFYAITAGLRGRITAQYGERLPAGGFGEDWSASLRNAYADRYVPWSEWAGKQPLGRSEWRSATLLVAVDNMTPRALDRQIGCRKGSGLDALRESLWWYASHAGWGDAGRHRRESLLDTGGALASIPCTLAEARLAPC